MLKNVQQRIEAFARVLDLIHSRRPVTAVFVGPPPGADFKAAVSRVCRVLSVGETLQDSSTQSIYDWLAVLLPLQIPVPASSAGDSMRELSTMLGDGDKEIVHQYLTASSHNARHVEGVLRKRVRDALTILSKRERN